jgi:FKBP-type peptidyl-prolyl cis-trans isomerase FkpA
MKDFARRAAVSIIAAAFGLGAAVAQERTQLTSDRDKVSYAIGMDVAHAVAPVAADMDMPAFEQSVRGAFAGGKPALSKEEAMATDQALRARVAARSGKPVPGAAPGAPPAALPPVDKTKVAQFVGGLIIGPSLASIKDEIDLSVVLQATHASLSGGKLLLTDSDAKSTLALFSKRMQDKAQARASVAGARNKAEGDAFLARNKLQKGVYATPSGLQYMVLRQGSGPRPKPGDHVRVNYRGTLLDGTVFDSSYDRGEAAEFGLDQVIPGWSEGVSMMPVGAKYRFWIPASLAYGDKGTPGGPVGPNATLVFDVELMSIL